MEHVKNKTAKQLSKKQIAVIDDLFEGRHNELDVIEKHKISKNVYCKWLGEKHFIDELTFRVESARRQSEMIIARFAPAAAAKLVELTGSDKEETSRKACLDIMAHPATINTTQEKPESNRENISPEVAGRLLAALAKENRQ